MKKSLIALAVLAAAGAASAQSSVTLFGVVDVGVTSARGAGNGRVTSLNDSMNSSSRLGFRGVEDLGGGLSASFWLEAGINPDNGTGDATNVNNQNVAAFNAVTGAGAAVRPGSQGLTFNRRSTLSLAGGFGELRLGRDLTPSFQNFAAYDPFGTVGSGSSTNMLIGAGGGTAAAAALPTSVRASNGIAYYTPGNLGGFFGSALYAFGENASNAAGGTADDGDTVSLRVGYAAGPFALSAGYLNTEYATGDYRQTNLGGSWDFGVAKLMTVVARDQIQAVGAGVGSRQSSWQIGTLVPFGAGEFKASYIRTNRANTNDDGSQLALGYVHNLSKRTAVYTTWARVDNRGNGVAFSNGRAATTPGGNTTAIDLGLRHAF
jgi:predicted porin